MGAGLIRWTTAFAVTLSALGASAEESAPPPSRAPRRLVLGVEALATVATEDDGYFNYSSYEQSTTELLRLRVDALLRLGSRAALLVGGRVDNGGGPGLSALYLRVRPFAAHAVDIQAGRIPPVFGAFPRRAYGADNPLIGQPFVYQYLTSLRPDALPASADDLVRMRGMGWANWYPIGDDDWDHGMPLVAADRWDTGVEVRWASEKVSVATAVTQGTPSNPRVRDDNSGKQFSARVESRPVLGVVLGASAARGEYVSRVAADALPPDVDSSHVQHAFGADAEYSGGHWLVRGEGILSRWSVPRVAEPFVPSSIESWGVFVEARRKIRPGLYAAARFDHVGFSPLTASPAEGSGVPLSTAWDYPVSRVEVGAGWNLRRNLLLKAAVQQNWRKGAQYGSKETVLAAQTLFWY